MITDHFILKYRHRNSSLRIPFTFNKEDVLVLFGPAECVEGDSAIAVDGVMAAAEQSDEGDGSVVPGS